MGSYNKTMSRINKTLEHTKSAVIIVPNGNKHERNSKLYTLQRAGISTLTEYMKQHNIKVPRSGSIAEVAVRFGGGRQEVVQMDMEDLTPQCVRIPKDEAEDGKKLYRWTWRT